MNLSKEKREKLINAINEMRKDANLSEKHLIALNEIENELNHKKYGLVWEEHTEEVFEKIKTHIPVFTEEKDKEIVVDNGELCEPQYNFLIEGDNLHSLYLLQKTHKGKIDVIYIDPPYNTGNKDFIYDDNMVGTDDGYRHSKWLSFMEKRLKIAKELLSEKGVIFISIDEHEDASLKLLCDNIFGERNYIENFVWIKNSIKNLSLTTSTNHEYIICYSKNIDIINTKKYFRIGKPGLKEVYDILSKCKSEKKSQKDSETIIRNFYKSNQELKGISMYNNVEIDKNNNYKLFRLSDISAPISKGAINTYEVIHPITKKPCKVPSRGWSYSKEKMQENIEKGLIYFNVDETYVPAYKRYLENVETEVCKSTITNFDEGKRDLIDIFESNNVFDNAKPTSLLKHLFIMINNNEATILDFFAGSGTTAQAVLELNKEDGGNRHFILCTNNENNICEEVTYKRIKTVITGVRDDGTKYSDGINANLKYLKTEFIPKNIKNVSKELNKHIKELIELEHGISIDKNINIMILTEEELDKLEEKWDKLKDTVTTIYKARNVMYSSKQKKLFKDVKSIIIPDYYFNAELKEVGEN